MNASGPSALRQTRAVRGSLIVSSRHASHGPRAIQRGTSLDTWIQQCCERAAGSEPPPSATASAWDRLPMPSTAVPARSASRSQSSCASGRVRASSPTVPSEPSATARRGEGGIRQRLAEIDAHRADAQSVG